MFDRKRPSVREINISNSTLLRVLGIVVGFILLLTGIYVARQPLALILIAAFLALSLSPIVNIMSKRLPGRSRGLATAIAYILILSAVGFVIYLLLPPLIRQTQIFIEDLPTYVDKLQTGKDGVSEFVRHYGLSDQISRLGGEVSQRYGAIGSSLLDLAGNIFNNVASIITIIILAFFMLVEGPIWIDKFWQLQPAHKRKHGKEVAARMYKVITGFVTGQLMIAALSGTSVFIVLTLLHIDFALPLSVLGAMLGLIPFIGATLAAIILVLVALVHSPTAAVILLIYFVIYQQIENNFIQPVVQAKTTEVSPLLVLIATIIGVFVAGLLGAILAVPLAGCLRVLANDYLERHHIKLDAETT